jgi:hypothetical protein
MLVLLVIVLAVLAWRKLNSSQASTSPVANYDQQPAAPSVPSNGPLATMENAIATMEGFFTPGSLAQRTHNPGDIGTYGGNVASYPSDSAGFNSLGTWLQNHASANPNWDFYDTMRYYLTGDTMGTPGPGQNPDAYAEYVAGQLGVDPTTPVSQVIGSGS